MSKNAIGIDLGGTQLRGAVMDELGNIIEEYSVPTEAEKGPDYVIEKMIQLISKLVSTRSVIGIGIGAPGPLHKGIVHLPPNLPNWNHIALVDRIYEAFAIPVYLDNDANVAALAEAHLGAGRGAKSIFYMTVSTGIGGGYVLDRHVIQGAMTCAGEVGNMIIASTGEATGQLNAGSLELLASGTAIAKRGKQLLGIDGGAEEVFYLADQGNESALMIVQQNMKFLAIGLANIIHLINPDQIVLGGGVMKSYQNRLPDLIKATDALVYPQLKGTTTITFAELKLKSGVMGAALLTGIAENKWMANN
jgi:glucokinase